MADQKDDAKIREDKIEAAAKETTANPRTKDRMVAALLRERAGLVQQGKDDRIAQVDEQLAAYGYKPDGAKADDDKAGDDGKAAARKQAPQGRSAKPQQQTSD